MTTKHLHTALHLAVSSNDKIMVARLLARAINSESQDYLGETALHLALKMRLVDNQQIADNRYIIEQLIKTSRDLNLKNHEQKAALTLAAEHNDVALVSLLLAHGADINVGDNSNNTALFIAAGQGNDAIVDVLLANNADVNWLNKFSETPLISVLWYEYEHIAYKLFTRSNLDIIYGTSQYHILLCRSARYPQFFIPLFQRCPLSQQLALAEKDYHGSNLLFMAAEHNQSLQTVLNLYPEHQRLAAIQQLTKKNESILHYAASDAQSLTIILALYPEHERLTRLKAVDERNNTILHKAASNGDALALVLAYYPEHKRLAAVQMANYNNSTVLELAAPDPTALQVILNLYPKDPQRKAMDVLDDKDKQSILSKVVYHPKSLKLLLTLYDNQSLDVFRLKTYFENTVLDLVSDKPASLSTILMHFPMTQRLMILKTWGSEKLLPEIVKYYPNTMRVVLSALPDDEKPAVLNIIVNQKNDTLLQEWASTKGHPQTIQVIFDGLANDAQRFALLELSVGKITLKEHLFSAKISLNVAEGFSLVDYVCLRSFLEWHEQSVNHTFFAYQAPSSFIEFAQKMKTINSFAAIKNELLAYLHTTNDSNNVLVERFGYLLAEDPVALMSGLRV